jgi:L-serine dehydratase
MQSLTQLYRIGIGPSASHAMGPRLAAQRFLDRQPDAAAYAVTFYGSLALTGRGHGTDQAVRGVMSGRTCELRWAPDQELAFHPNGMRFHALAADGAVADEWEVFSVGGGALAAADEAPPAIVYPFTSMAEVLAFCEQEGCELGACVIRFDDDCHRHHLPAVWQTMTAAVERGLATTGTLNGPLKLARKAAGHAARAAALPPARQRTGRVTAYALAVSEENAAGGEVATAPTCGACGVLPGVLTWFHRHEGATTADVIEALAVAGLVGNLCKQNASISGAEVGCQGEVGVACAMAAAAAARLQGASTAQIEYAAEMALEHHLGLTCDPVGSLVQIPCIERNAVAAVRAIDCAEYALLSDGSHLISFDEVVETMARTGRDMHRAYRETSEGGLAAVHAERNFCA